mmetsp:Transcript_63279/g.145523  ORF Transcript_63279/g.145523 Transcript_63279/m.145523 type:complete len:243 (-) Transcript_63279:659-1387(-)
MACSATMCCRVCRNKSSLSAYTLNRARRYNRSSWANCTANPSSTVDSWSNGISRPCAPASSHLANNRPCSKAVSNANRIAHSGFVIWHVSWPSSQNRNLNFDTRLEQRAWKAQDCTAASSCSASACAADSKFEASLWMRCSSSKSLQNRRTLPAASAGTSCSNTAAAAPLFIGHCLVLRSAACSPSTRPRFNGVTRNSSRCTPACLAFSPTLRSSRMILSTPCNLSSGHRTVDFDVHSMATF